MGGEGAGGKSADRGSRSHKGFLLDRDRRHRKPLSGLRESRKGRKRLDGRKPVQRFRRKCGAFERLLHELGVKELTPVPKLSVTRSSLPRVLLVVALDSRGWA